MKEHHCGGLALSNDILLFLLSYQHCGLFSMESILVRTRILYIEKRSMVNKGYFYKKPLHPAT